MIEDNLEDIGNHIAGFFVYRVLKKSHWSAKQKFNCLAGLSYPLDEEEYTDDKENKKGP